MLDANRYFREKGVEALVVLQVHDEISCYAKIEHANEAAIGLRKGMENNRVAAMLDIPMVADPVVCDNLKESK